jgi:ABC-type nitrate/sulfonate/bicarbonate transport system substrate-binding protein
MKPLKKQIPLLLGLALVLAGCGGAAPAASSPPPPSVANVSPGASLATQPKPPKLVVSYNSTGQAFAPLWMAKEIGAFDKYGVSVDLRQVDPNVAANAIVAKELDVEEESGPAILTLDANGHEDVAFIAGGFNHPGNVLLTAASITRAEQLKGKLVASDKPGSAADYSLQVSLSLMGLKPGDVEVRPLGPPPIVLPALLSGQVPAGMLGPPQRFTAEDKGFHLLVDVSSRPYQNVGLAAKRSRLNELAPALKPLLAAYRDGILAWNSQPDLAMRVLDKYAKVGDADVLKRTYAFNMATGGFEASLQPTTEGLQAIIDFLASTNVPALKGAKAEQFIDARFLKDLPKS